MLNLGERVLLRACPKCRGGDLALTWEGDWHCLQCGHYIYARDTSLYVSQEKVSKPPKGNPVTRDWEKVEARRQRITRQKYCQRYCRA